MNILLIIPIWFLSSFTQPKEKIEKEIFDGQFILQECIEVIPLSYSTKDKGPFLEAVNRINGEEIVLVTVQKKTNPTYQFYKFVKYQSGDGESAYLVPQNKVITSGGQQVAMFLGYKKKKHFFYNSDCFREKLIENDTLNKKLNQE